MAYYQLDDVFGYQDANAIKRLWANPGDPETGEDGEIFLDTNLNPPQLKRREGGQWKTVCGMARDGLCVDISGQDLNQYADTGMYRGENVVNAPTNHWYYFLVFKHADDWVMQIAYSVNLINGIRVRVNNADNWAGGWKKMWFESGDGHGSGLNADLLDGVEGASFIRGDVDQDVDADTRWINGKFVSFGSGDKLTIHHTDVYSSYSNYVGDMFLQQKSNGDNMVFNASNAAGTKLGLLTLDPDLVGGSVYLPNSAGSLYIGGTAEPFGALRLRQDGTAAHIENEGPGGLNIRNTANGENIYVWANQEDGTNLLMVRINPDNYTFGVGNDNGIRLYNDSTAGTQLQTVSHPLTIRSFADGASVFFNLDNSQGDTKNVMTVSPDSESVLIMGNTAWHAGNDGPGSGLDADTVDGVQVASLMRKDTDNTIEGVIVSNIIKDNAIIFDGGHSRITVHDGYGNFNIKSGVDHNNLIDGGLDGGSHIRLDHNGTIYLGTSSAAQGTSFVDESHIIINSTGVEMKNDVTITDQLVIPLNEPGTLKNGSIWIS